MMVEAELRISEIKDAAKGCRGWHPNVNNRQS
jgi:hypothetical protein